MWHTVSFFSASPFFISLLYSLSLSFKAVHPVLFVCSQTLITEKAENLVCAGKTEINPKQTDRQTDRQSYRWGCLKKCFDTWEILGETV